MKLTLHFWGTMEANDQKAIQQQVREWAATEPNVEWHRVMRLYRPYPERRFWWEADVIVRLRTDAEPPLTLGLSA